MCGIAGIVSLGGQPPTLAELRTMAGTMSHRGPDDEGFYVGDGIGLAMRRLSIIDLDAGQQPITNEDGSVWLVFNGEIYNYRQLRQDLAGRGHVLATSTDTEVIVHLYEELGARCVEPLRGMFAFALWDVRRRSVLLARDRLGIKPLYYTVHDKRLVFGSELKAILSLGAHDCQLDWNAFSYLLTFGTTPRAQSIVAGIGKLEPGHVLEASAHGPPRVTRYWDVRFEPDRARPEAYFTQRLTELLEESVDLHMVSDVPVGAFLSGGMDSSSVVAIMAGLAREPVRTFSIGYADAAFDERPYAQLVARTIGTVHQELLLEPQNVDELERLVWALDEPFADSSAIPTYAVSKLAAESVKVVLSGDGGDELFAGYDKYAVEERERRWDALPGPARAALAAVASRLPETMRGRRFLTHVTLSGRDRYLDAATLFSPSQLGRLLSGDARRAVSPHHPWELAGSWLRNGTTHWLSVLQYADLHTYLPLDILTKVDRMSMAHSLEARVPLLDHRLVEFAATIPPELLLRGGVGKRVFKDAMRHVLPAAVRERPKRGFAIPLGRWFRGQWTDYVRDIMLSTASRQRGLFDPAQIERLISKPERGQEDLDLQLWTLLTVELWCRMFMDGATDLDRARRATAIRRPLGPVPAEAGR